LDDMISAFERGEYGYPSVMAPVVSILSQGNGEILKKELPAELVEFFVETLKREPPREGIRERREGESEKDYLAYKILECAAMSGYLNLRFAELEKKLKQEFSEQEWAELQRESGEEFKNLSDEELYRMIDEKIKELEMREESKKT